MKDKASTLTNDVIEVYSDGACEHNPGGNSGAGYVVRYMIDDNGGNSKEQISDGSVGFRSSTNNRMEIIGTIEGLGHAIEILDQMVSDGKPVPFKQLTVTSDSSYVCGAFGKGWINKWRKNNWLTYNGDPVKNVDLWEKTSELLDTVKNKFGLSWRFIHVDGHKGYRFNERCDKLAVSARKGDNLLVDRVYENSLK